MAYLALAAAAVVALAGLLPYSAWALAGGVTATVSAGDALEVVPADDVLPGALADAVLSDTSADAASPDASADEPDVTLRFADVKPQAWYVESVQWVFDAGVMSGYGDEELFGIGEELTRAELASLLANYVGVCTDVCIDTTGIADLAEGGRWYTGAVNWAVANGIITGYDNADGSKTFAPNDPVTREQAMTVLMRFVSRYGQAPDPALSAINAFPDAAQISRWADDAVAWAVEQGVVSGATRVGQQWIDPARAVLREEMAKMIRMVSLLLEEGAESSVALGSPWEKCDGAWRYELEPGVWALGWQDIDGERYFFGEDGVLRTGWVNDGDGRYYLQPHGPMHTGWLTLGGARYCFAEDGRMLTGWQDVDGERLYFDANGRLQALDLDEWLDAADGATSAKKLTVSAGLGGAANVSKAALAKVQADVSAIEKKGYSVGFVLVDLTTGATISYNAQQAFYGASTIKGPYACAVAATEPTRAARLKSTIEAAVNWSSNEDYGSLRRNFGAAPVEEWLEKAGEDSISASSWWPTMCPVDLAKLWLCNYEFLSAGEGAASWLASYFEGTAESFIDGGVGDAHPIYSKAGWIWDGPKYFVFNDAGYVDKAGAPYVVAIMSSSGEGCKAQLESLAAHLDAAHDELL